VATTALSGSMVTLATTNSDLLVYSYTLYVLRAVGKWYF
jgi:hypothetical protein